MITNYKLTITSSSIHVQCIPIITGTFKTADSVSTILLTWKQ